MTLKDWKHRKAYPNYWDNKLKGQFIQLGIPQGEGKYGVYIYGEGITSHHIGTFSSKTKAIQSIKKWARSH